MENSIGISDGLNRVSQQESLKQSHSGERIPIDEVRCITISSNFSHSYIDTAYKTYVNLEKEAPPEQIAHKNLAEQLDDNKSNDIDFENRGKGKGFGIKQGNEQIVPLFISEKNAMNMTKDERNLLRSAVMRDGQFSARIVTPVFNDNGRYTGSTGRRYDLQILMRREDIEAAENVGLAIVNDKLLATNGELLPLEKKIIKHYIVNKNPTIGDLVYFRAFRSNNVCGIGGRVKGIDKI